MLTIKTITDFTRSTLLSAGKALQSAAKDTSAFVIYTCIQAANLDGGENDAAERLAIKEAVLAIVDTEKTPSKAQYNAFICDVLHLGTRYVRDTDQTEQVKMLTGADGNPIDVSIIESFVLRVKRYRYTIRRALLSETAADDVIYMDNTGEVGIRSKSACSKADLENNLSLGDEGAQVLEQRRWIRNTTHDNGISLADLEKNAREVLEIETKGRSGSTEQIKVENALELASQNVIDWTAPEKMGSTDAQGFGWDVTLGTLIAHKIINAECRVDPNAPLFDVSPALALATLEYWVRQTCLADIKSPAAGDESPEAKAIHKTMAKHSKGVKAAMKRVTDAATQQTKDDAALDKASNG